MKTRIESDSIGELAVPTSAYYGVQSLRAFNNFQIKKQAMHPQLIKSLAQIKKAAAYTNLHTGQLEPTIAQAIIQACDEIIGGGLQDQFIVDAIQGGAGTSANMNANEVIANRAIELLGGTKGDYQLVHPNDHVNKSQSTNDVYPTAGKLTILALMPPAIKALKRLEHAFQAKAHEFNEILKMGRTQLQDAVPMRLGQSFSAYASVIKRDSHRLTEALHAMTVINLGATAIGSCINADLTYVSQITANLSEVCDIKLSQAEDLFDGTQNLDGFVHVSSALKTCAVNLSKICNDLRLLSSGPIAGIGEINLPPKQNGSSIMPGKINPVIPEVVSQVAFGIIGNDLTVTMAAEAGQLELNAFEPIVFYKLFESIETLEAAVTTLIDNCITGITANKAHCEDLVARSAGIATALCPVLGYKKSAEIAKRCLKTGQTVRSLVLEEGLLDEATLDHLLSAKTLTTAHYSNASLYEKVI